MSWPTIPLRRLFDVVNGGTPTSDPENWGGDVPWATPVDVGEISGPLRTTRRTLTRTGAHSGSAVIPAGSILVSTRAPIGYTALTDVPMAFNQGCRALVPKKDLDVRYFRYQLEAGTERIQARGQGTTFSELSSDALASVEVVSPDVEDQRRIADYLDSEAKRVSALIDSLTQSVHLLGERREAGVIDQVTGGGYSARRSSRIPWVGTIPESWNEARVGLLARMGSGHTPSRNRPELWENPTIPWITTGEVSQVRDDRRETITETRESISELGLANSAAELHPSGTVVLCRTAASAGYSAVMGGEMATSQDLVTWTCGPRLDPYYLLWCLRAMRQDLLGRLAMGSTHKTIYVPDLQMLRIPLPSVPEQKKIVDNIRSQNASTDQAVDSIERQIQLLNERRQALITAAVTGQIDVTTARGADVS